MHDTTYLTVAFETDQSILFIKVSLIQRYPYRDVSLYMYDFIILCVHLYKCLNAGMSL